jgi:hypothetical protein
MVAWYNVYAGGHCKQRCNTLLWSLIIGILFAALFLLGSTFCSDNVWLANGYETSDFDPNGVKAGDGAAYGLAAEGAATTMDVTTNMNVDLSTPACMVPVTLGGFALGFGSTYVVNSWCDAKSVREDGQFDPTKFNNRLLGGLLFFIILAGCVAGYVGFAKQAAEVVPIDKLKWAFVYASGSALGAGLVGIICLWCTKCGSCAESENAQSDGELDENAQSWLSTDSYIKWNNPHPSIPMDPADQFTDLPEWRRPHRRRLNTERHLKRALPSLFEN